MFLAQTRRMNAGIEGHGHTCMVGNILHVAFLWADIDLAGKQGPIHIPKP